MGETSITKDSNHRRVLVLDLIMNNWIMIRDSSSLLLKNLREIFQKDNLTRSPLNKKTTSHLKQSEEFLS